MSTPMMLSDADKEAILRIPLVKNVICDKDGIVVQLKAFTAYNEHDEDAEEFSWDDGEVFIHIRAYEADDEEVLDTLTIGTPAIAPCHPNAGSGGYPCFGNVEDLARTLLTDEDYVALINLVCEFLQVYTY